MEGHMPHQQCLQPNPIKLPQNSELSSQTVDLTKLYSFVLLQYKYSVVENEVSDIRITLLPPDGSSSPEGWKKLIKLGVAFGLKLNW